MISFLSLSAFVTPSALTPYGRSEQPTEMTPEFWRSLEALGFDEAVVEEANTVIRADRWEAANRKLGETVQYLDVTGRGEDGVAIRRAGSNYFVEIMQQFSESLLAELEELARLESLTPILQRAVRHYGGQPALQRQTEAALRHAETMVMQFHTLIPARLSEFRDWAMTYDVLGDARAFFAEYTGTRDGESRSLSELFEQFTVI